VDGPQSRATRLRGGAVINFGLHFRLARRDLLAPAAAVGAMLPDVWRIADRRVRPALGDAPVAGSARVGEVIAGVDHHRRADAVFHESAVFREGERALRKAFGGIEIPRLSLFGHIAWELCLDGALVRREGEELLAEVRAAIAIATEPLEGEAPVDAAARIHHAARRGDTLPEGFEARVARLLNEIGRGPWLTGYARGDVVAERIDGIRRSLGFPRVEGSERERLGLVLAHAIDRAEAAVAPLLAMVV